MNEQGEFKKGLGNKVAIKTHTIRQ